MRVNSSFFHKSIMAKTNDTPVECIETDSTKLIDVQTDHPGAFIHVNDDNGDDNLYIGDDKITDKFNVGDSNLNAPTRKIGGLEASTVGQLRVKGVSEILLDILRPDVIEPTVSTQAGVTISYGGPKLIETGAVLPGKSDISEVIKDGVWSDGTPYSGGHDSIVLNMSPDRWDDVSDEGTYSISGSVTFTQGGIPEDNFGTGYPDKRYNGGVKNSNVIKITAVHPVYVNDGDDITVMNKHVVDYLSGVVTLNVDIPEEIDGTSDKFKVYLPGVFSTFDVKQFNPLTGRYDINVEMIPIDGEESKYIRTGDVFDTLGSSRYEIKLKK